MPQGFILLRKPIKIYYVEEFFIASGLCWKVEDTAAWKAIWRSIGNSHNYMIRLRELYSPRKLGDI